MIDLDAVDLSLRLGSGEYERRLYLAQRRLLHLRLINGGLLDHGELGPAVCVVFEGWDAAGKGGAIKRLVEPLDSRHVRVAAFSKPTHDEKRHQFLWRFYPSLPGLGGMAIFDRSWYGRILVERVEGFATDEQWGRAYEEINQFERSLVMEDTVLIKVWMHISHDEQERRFKLRAADPLKSWKLGPEDWRNREKRPQYEAALRDMLAKTDHELAPWDVIEAENKKFGRVKVIETVIARIENGMRRMGIEPPPFGTFEAQP